MSNPTTTAKAINLSGLVYRQPDGCLATTEGRGYGITVEGRLLARPGCGPSYWSRKYVAQTVADHNGWTPGPVWLPLVDA